MALMLLTSVSAPPLLLPPPDPPPFVPDLSTVSSSPEPPDPPDPLDSLAGSSTASSTNLHRMFLDLVSKLFHAFSLLNLGVSFPLMPSGGTPFALLRAITAMCSSFHQALHVAWLEFWFATPCLSHHVLTPFKGIVSLRGSSIFKLSAFLLNMPVLGFLQYKDVMIASIFIFMLVLPQYEVVMSLFNLRLLLPQYEGVTILIRLKFLLPHREAVMIVTKSSLLLPQYEDVIRKLWPRSFHGIVPLVWFLENLRWFMKKTFYFLTRNNLGSWTPDLFIENWWFSQPHISPKLRFSSHLVGSVSWCFVAYAFIAVFQDAYSLVDSAFPDRRSPSVLSDFQSFISRFSTIGVSNISCLSVMYASICFFLVFYLAFVATVSLAIVAIVMYLLNPFSIVGE